MKTTCSKILALTLAAAALSLPSHVAARSANAPGMANGPSLQCVPYAREVSGVRIFGDAHTWWGQAEGRYERGNIPQVGAVMAFRPHGNMRLGHVAAVSEIIDSRTVLISHSNWSLINGRRGQIEDNVRAIDVSPNNDWSQVRIWYAPINAIGGTAWPMHGFIYKGRAPSASPARIWASAPASQTGSARQNMASNSGRQPRANSSRDFSAAMAMDELPNADSFDSSFAFLQ